MMPSESSELDKKQNGSAIDDDSRARTRVSRACTRCRARKDRCDGQRPSCSACRNSQAVCCYEPATKKRGLPEGYVRGLEKLLALLIGKVDGFEDTASQLMHEYRPELLKIWNHTTIGEELHTTWKESKIIQELETLLGGLDQHALSGHKRKRERDDEGDDHDEDIDAAFHTTCEYRIQAATEAGLENTIRSSNTLQIGPEITFPPNAIELVDHYFAHTHCWFPIVDRPQVLRACYEVSRGKLPSGGNESTSSLLWAIFAYTSRHTKPSQQAKPQVVPASNSGMDQHYHEVARSKIPQDAQDLTPNHARALLILALLEIGTGRWKAAWSLVGQAVRIVLCDASSGGTTRNDASLFQGCAVLDIAIASHLGAVPYLRRSDFETRSLMNEDGYEEWEPWSAPGHHSARSREPSFATSCFNRLTEVLLINADLLTMLPKPERLDRNYVQSLLAKLHHLQTTVPGTMPPSLQSPPHHIYLQLCHISVQMRLVDLPIDTGAGPSEKAKLACNVLGLLELCKNAKVIGLEHIPPFLVDGVEMACKLARSSSPAFGAASGLPSYHEFNRTASELVATMGDTWPVFSTIANDHQRSNSYPLSHIETPPSRTNIMLSPHALSSPSASDLTAQKRLRGSLGTSQRNNSTPLTSQPTFSSEDMSLPDLNNWQYPRTSQPSFTMPNLGSMQLPTAAPSSASNDQNMNSMSNIIGLDMSGGTPTGPLGLAIPEPSPSFQGDEIDAIFHEMAHLDTNEWTSERALGLRDFGFADDLTFQAFCNDPERLIAPGDGLQPALSSNSQTWTFADPGSGIG